MMVEPAPTTNTLPNGSTFLGPNTADIRQYLYNRTRYGFDGELDYKLGDMSSVYLRGLFSRIAMTGSLSTSPEKHSQTPVPPRAIE